MFQAVPLTEIVSVAPTYCDGLALANIINGNMHMVYYVDHLDALGQPERLITQRLILPMKGLIAARDTIARVMMTATVPMPHPPRPMNRH